MSRKYIPKRIVEAAFLEDIGVVTAPELLDLAEALWGNWRDRITDHRTSGDGIKAYCAQCGGHLYIRTNTGKPLFAHYRDAPLNCTWHHISNSKLRDIRAAQYQGQQESPLHRLMCEQLGRLVALDPRCQSEPTINKRLASTVSDRYKLPDVCFEWEGFGKFAVEFQMSNTFEMEISDRSKFYEQEGIPLLWILGVDFPTKSLPQNFRDVIRRHRGNMFLLNRAAIEASFAQKTLILACALQNEEGFDQPRLVRVDDLTMPKTGLPYLEDRVTATLLKKIDIERNFWFEHVRIWHKVRAWEAGNPIKDLSIPVSKLLAAAFSIYETARENPINYASGHPNIKGMLNNHLHHGHFKEYARLIETMLRNSAEEHLLSGTVGEHIKRCQSAPQKDENSPEWRFLEKLFPEILDPKMRDFLKNLDALPAWAQNASA
jgi:hypothetical protein